jgi:GMP synthase-like glutamine amidotransferase
MKIGILQCDQVHEKFIAEHGPYPDMFAALLHQADPSLTFVVYDVEHDEFPQEINAADAYLITGSRHSVNDDFPWIANLEEFVRQLHSAKKKVVGICFGHQLIAKALGGKVIKSPKGWGIGMSTNQITQQKYWMNPPQDNFHLLVSHQEQVVELPSDAEVLASSDFCPFYLLQIKENLITVQGHPEFSKGYSQALIEDRKAILGKERLEQGLMSLTIELDSSLFARWIVNFLVKN